MRRTNDVKKKTLGQQLLGAPYVVWAALFVIVPLIIVVYYAFTDAGGNFTMDNIAKLSEYKEVFWLSIEYSFIATVICLLVSYPFAYLMSRKRESTQRIMMMLVMLPMWMNLLIRTYSWMNILERNGLINNFLALFGVEPLKMIGTPGAVIFGMIYNYIPYMILPIYTVMSKIDVSVLEAAEDLGSNGFSKLRRIILPMSMPGVVSGFTMVFVPSVSTFYISQKLGGKIMLIGDAIEKQIQSLYNYNLGAALSLVLMVMILICMALMKKFAGDSNDGLIM
ncbi:MAG: ABC transporter permease [Clostridia bacterium]|nr:ABC transporter permease [Oscillospiraceae bacterium]MBO5128693.1 ABC transporter permease [Clostridia bacterium]MBO5257288.1 ABC transporter permease [Clostridia bacterium]